MVVTRAGAPVIRQTRKWSFVEQEATRLNALKLSVREIARRLGVSPNSVMAWRKSGKLPNPNKAKSKSTKKKTLPPPSARQSPAAWARAIRAEYKLDATDEQLVTGAETMLSQSRDMTLSSADQRRAFAEFRAIVRQLNLPGREDPAIPAPSAGDSGAPSEPVAKPRLVPSPIADPRAARMAVNS